MIDLDPDPAGWSIRSSDGRSQMTCRPTRSSQVAGTVTGSVILERQAWQRDRPLKDAALTRDFRIDLPQVVLRIDALRRLRQRLVEWQVNPAGLTCERCNAAVGDQALSISIGRDERLIADVFKPAFIVTYSSGPSMTGRWAFLVDPSCLHLFTQCLGEFLRARSSPWV